MSAKLILMVAPAGAGKTTFSLKLQSELSCERLSSDELRAKFGTSESDLGVSKLVFAHMQTEAEKLLAAGKTVIIDATNLSAKSRNRFIPIARKLNLSVIAYMVDVPVKVAIERNASRERKVPVFAIHQHYKALTKPDKAEVDEFYTINENGQTTKVF